MDFKTKTALCIARLYNSSACVFWLAQTPTERTQQTEDGYWCRNKLEVVFSCRVPCLWAWSSIPRTPFPARAGSCCSATSEFQLWAQQEGAPSWRHHLGTAAAELCENSRTQQNNGKPSRAVNCLQVNVSWLLTLLQPCSRTWWSVEPWPAAPEARGTAQGRTTVGCCTRTQRMLRGFSRTEHCRFYLKSKVPRVLHRLVLTW